MDVHYKVQGKERKQLVEQIATITEEEFKYLGVPTCAYQIGPHFLVDKAGTLQIDDFTDSDIVENLLDKLNEQGFTFETPELTESTTEENAYDPDTLEIRVRVENFGEQEQTNLNNLISSKCNLLKKAIGTTRLDYHFENGELRFPWFTLNKEQGEALIYQQLVVALINKAKTAKRIRPVENATDNEKFTFRVFLISLGMVGDEYKEARKLLMKNLSGNSAFKNGGKTHVSK
ncbi:hypothetical protein ACI1UG_02755 [Lactococcus garvieae]|uniref:hypothetical protein n=1 Tax=Lactococcus garvieae TaxID=1363 RepID=UPI00385530A6